MSEDLHVRAATWAVHLDGRPELFWLADTPCLDPERVGHHDKVGVDVVEVARHMVLLLTQTQVCVRSIGLHHTPVQSQHWPVILAGTGGNNA